MEEYFLVTRGDKVIKLNKGITEEKVNELLGHEYQIEPAQNNGDQKRIYHFKNANTNSNSYKLLLRRGILERITKISQ